MKQVHMRGCVYQMEYRAIFIPSLLMLMLSVYNYFCLYFSHLKSNQSHSDLLNVNVNLQLSLWSLNYDGI